MADNRTKTKKECNCTSVILTLWVLYPRLTISNNMKMYIKKSVSKKKWKK